MRAFICGIVSRKTVASSVFQCDHLYRQTGDVGVYANILRVWAREYG